MLKVFFLFGGLLMLSFFSCTEAPLESPKFEEEEVLEPTNKVILSSEIKWEQLNPARGDRSPQAGTIWGDRKGGVATGFLAKFVDGFSSPPHIHNVTYRAMVVKGLIHNAAPGNKTMWMPAGSFWTQPVGEPHITAAKGEECIAYVEIDAGPYLVQPVEEAFDNRERPVNVSKNNVVWLDASKTRLIAEGESTKNLMVAFLWENDGLTGNLIKLPTNFEGEIISEGEQFHAVIIEGNTNYKFPKTEEVKLLDAGSYFTSTGKSKHYLKTNEGQETTIYIRTNGDFNIK